MEEQKIDKRIKRVMSDEQKMKMSNARDAYWARVRELKKLAPEVERLSGELAEANGTAKAIEPSQARDHILRKIFAKKDKLIDAQIDAATGLYTIIDGKRQYQKAPDRAVGEYLLNQLIGRPTESLEIKQVTKILVDL